MYAPDFNIPLPDGRNVALLFNSWTYRNYCQRIGVEYEDLLMQIANGSSFRAKNLPTLLTTAAEAHAKFNDREFVVKELDADKWIDALGGFSSPKIVNELFKIFVAKLLNKSQEEFEVILNKAVEPQEEPAEDKKKAEPNMAPILPISSESGIKAMGN